MPYATKANKIPRRIPSIDAWTIKIGALKISRSIEFELKKMPPKIQGA